MFLHSENDSGSQRSKEEIVVVISWRLLVTFLITALALISAMDLAWPAMIERFGPSLGLSTDSPEYGRGDPVRIEGLARESLLTPLASEPVSIEVRSPGGRVAWIDQVKTDKEGRFTSSFRLREDAEPGTYEVYASLRVAQGKSTFSVRG